MDNSDKNRSWNFRVSGKCTLLASIVISICVFLSCKSKLEAKKFESKVNPQSQNPEDNRASDSNKPSVKSTDKVEIRDIQNVFNEETLIIDEKLIERDELDHYIEIGPFDGSFEILDWTFIEITLVDGSFIDLSSEFEFCIFTSTNYSDKPIKIHVYSDVGNYQDTIIKENISFENLQDSYRLCFLSHYTNNIFIIGIDSFENNSTNSINETSNQKNQNYVTTQPPPDPTNVVAIVDGVNVTLTWTSGGGLTSDYRIAYRQGSIAPSNCSTDIAISENEINENTRSHSFVLSPSTQYSFRICSIKSDPIQVSPGITANVTTSSPNCATSSFTVSPLYSNGTNWNDYIKNDGPTQFSASNTVCSGTESNFNDCLHGGEMRKVVVVGRSSCDGLSASDNLTAFDWICDESTNPVRFISVLSIDKGLSDLISVTAFKSNYVNIVDSACSGSIGTSSPSNTWWTNTIEAAPDTYNSAQVLGVSGTIYTVTDGTNMNNESQGYQLTSDKVALVGLNEFQINARGTFATNCNSSTGEPGSNYKSFLCVGSQKYIWIEGIFNGKGVAKNNYFRSLKHSRIQNSIFVDFDPNSGNDAIILLDNSTGNRIISTSIGKAVYDGVLATASDSNLFLDLTISGIGDDALVLEGGASNNNFISTSVYRTAYGIYLNDESNDGNIFVNTLLSSIAEKGFNNMSNDTTVLGMSIFNSTVTATNFALSGQIFDPSQGNHNFYSSLLFYNLNGGSIFLDAYQPGVVSYFSQYYSKKTDSALDIQRTYSINLSLRYNFLFDNGSFTACWSDFTNGDLPINSACLSSSASPYLILDESVGDIAIAGKADSDNVNVVEEISGSLGQATFAELEANPVDAFKTESRFRTWGKSNAAAYPGNGTNFIGNCGSGTCQLFDYRFSSSDTILLNINGGMADGIICPDSLDPAATERVITNNIGITYLVNAIEVQNDLRGNDNGLCESGESCIYSPNIGAYQGHGALTKECTFSDGNGFSNMKISGFENNGL